MEYPIRRHLLAAAGTLVVLAILLPILLLILSATFIASIPSRIGKHISIEEWIQRGMDTVFDFDLMRQFRNDMFYKILPHIEVSEEFDRWWLHRELEKSIEHINADLRSGEYSIVVLLAIGSILFDSLFGLPLGVILTILAIA